MLSYEFNANAFIPFCVIPFIVRKASGETETDSHPHRQTDTKTVKGVQTERQAERQISKHTDAQADKQVQKDTDKVIQTTK